MSKRGAEARVGNEGSSGHDVTSSTSSENELDMLMKVALAVKEQEEGDKYSGFLSTRGPIEEQMGVEMASKTFPEQGLSEPLSLEDSFGKSEENTSQAIHVALAGAATRGDTYTKNVMLLKNEDLAQRDGKILMPTTIEMARTRKTGQYKKQVQFSKSMSEDAVREKIQETFPAFNLSVRFYCASISNTDSTLQFHGDPRVWDGKTIRKILKGNSALYIVMDEIENGLDMLMKVALAAKEREEGDNDSGFLSTRGPIEERMDVEMASVTFPEQGLSEPLSSEDLSEKLEGFSPPNQVLRVLVRIATNYTGQQLFELFFNSPAAGKAVFLAYKLMRRFSDENWDDQEFPPTVDWLVISAEEAQRRLNHTDEIKETGYLSDEESSSSESSCSETFYSEDNSSTTSSEDHADEIKETGYLGDEESLSSKSSSSESSYSEDNSSRTSSEDHTDEIKETKYEGDEESSSCKSSSSKTSYSEDKFSTTSSEDLDENPSSEECCGPEGVAKYEGKNEAKEESLMKACMEFASQDPDRLEPKPKINEQERGEGSSEEDSRLCSRKIFRAPFGRLTMTSGRERDVGNLCSTAGESRGQNIQQRSSVFDSNFDQNSMAEKTRRAKERSDEEETGDLNGAPL